MTHERALARARELFLRDDNLYGCAETTLVALLEAFGLGDEADSALCMALNGGIAWRGWVCGAISGAAVAVGRLAASRIPDHKEAKRIARALVNGYIDRFRAAHGATNCRDLVGLDIHEPAQHARFIESGIWRDVCMRQIEFAVRELAPLADEREWERAISAL
ncbi:MAG: C-GCAxxG-C-C family protein [Anaerolineae bacterium]|nr:C-GCAxxG-C-C family protein [Anaerolineae bacterium]